MNNKYDVTLSEEEKKQLAKNIESIKNFLCDLVKDFETITELSTTWCFYDDIWGKSTCKIFAKRDYKYKGICGASEKEWYSRVSGQIGGLYLNFEEDMNEKINYSSHREYALSLIDNWQQVKEDLLRQLEQAKKTKDMINNFNI